MFVLFFNIFIFYKFLQPIIYRYLLLFYRYLQLFTVILGVGG